jgi:signal transduction histidine kinase/DNA-binding LacI/PurR family transcriptional regulator/AraC-like DNA-binding protein
MHNRPEETHRNRPRIGILMRGFRRPDYDMWLGATEAARQHAIDVVTFTGQALASPDEYEAEANAVYELIDPTQFDGLFLVTSGIGLYVGAEGMQAFCQRFGDLPLISTQMVLAGVPSLLIDNYQGMHEIVSHLIMAHNHRRLAFLRGPISHRGAQERYAAYRAALEEHGIPYDSGLVSTPPEGWIDEAGIDAFLSRICGQSGAFPDAIIGTSASLADQALTWLNARGIRVPEDIALSGFDNFPYLAGTMPPLTTTHVPFVEIGHRAVELLIAQMNGHQVPMENRFPARIVIRQSCGCRSASVEHAGAIDEVISMTGDEQSPQSLALHLAGCRDRLIELLLSLAAGTPSSLIAPAWTEKLIDAFISELTCPPKSGEAFLDTLKRLAIQLLEAEDDLSMMQEALSFFRQAVKEGVETERTPPDGLLPYLAAEDLLSQARVLLQETERIAASAARIKMGRQAVDLAQIGHQLTTVTDLESLTSVLARALPHVGMQGCFLCLYEDPRYPAGWAKLYYCGSSREQAALSEPGARFSARELLPAPALSAFTHDDLHNLVVAPLFVRQQQFGFIVFQTGPRDILFEDQIVDSTVYDMLRGYISDALHGILLYDKTLRARQQAEEADRLKSRFLSMVSHELRTPLNLIVSLSEMLVWRQEQHQEELARIHASAQHLDGLIRDVLDLASSQVGQLRLSREPLDLSQVMEVVTLIGEQMAQDKGLVWSAEIPERLPQIWGDRTRLRQVALNLVSNAFRFTSEGSVRLVVEADGDTITTSVSDSGLGVPPSEHEAIFDEFRQSDRTAARGYGGLGLGLSISSRLVELHGGTIGVTSSGVEGEGATFYFTLPTMSSQHSKAVVEPGNAKSLDSPPIVILTEQPKTSMDMTLSVYLTERGYTVKHIRIDPSTAPSDTKHWLNQVLSSPPASLILDMEPASERGWALMRLLKEDPRTHSTPVLFYSLLKNGDSGAMLALDYLTKPVSLSDLAELLERQGLASAGSSAACAEPTCLIVDDEPDILATHTWLVQSQLPGSRLLQASNGREALALMTESPPDLVLLDLMMPEMNGFEVISAMQTYPDLCQIPVVVLTAKTLTSLELESLDQGAIKVLGKGLFSAEETLQHIETALRRTRAADPDTRNIVRQAIAYIHEHYMEPISRKEIASYVNLSSRHLDRCFCEEMDLTPIAYLNRFRLRQARRLLQDTSLSISHVATAVGFSDSGYFCRVFKRDIGVSPSDYRRNRIKSE